MTINRSTGEWSLMARQQAAVAHVGQLGLKGLDPAALLDEALQVVAESLNTARATLLELDPDWRTFSVRAACVDGTAVPATYLESVRVPTGRDSMPGYTVMQGGVVTTSDLLEDQRFRARAPEFDADARAAIAAPVGWGERPWGVLGAYASELRDWTEDDIHFVQSMANTIGLAIYRSRAEDALRESSTRLELSLQASGLAAWSWELASDLIDFTPAAVDIYGLDPSTTRLNGDEYLEFVHPDDRTALRGDTFESLQTTGEYNTSYRWVNHARGEVRWLESWGQLVDDSYGNPSRLIGVTADVTERRLAEDTKEALLAAEQRARLEGDRARGRLSLLLEGAALFNASLDPNEILAALPDFCVPRICDVCLVDVIDEHQSLVEAAGAGVSETAIADVRALRARRAQLAGIGGVYSEQRVAQTGQSVLIGHITDEHYRAAASDDDHLALFRRAAVMSSIVVPLVARDRVIGVLSLLNVEDRSGRPFDADDLALVQELADRAALAVDNGRLFESRNRVARSLQAALLPPKLPDIDGLDLAARYQVAEDDIEIGGDFYDVIEMGDRAWGLVIGDVCGRGPEAAALTGLMRHSVRAAVVRQRLPSGVLAQTNAAVIGQIDDSRFCTAAYLRVEVPDDGPVRVVASSAGHPRPVVLRRDGSTETLECSGLLLGVVATPRYVDVEVDLAPGDAVVLYTDGVTEARQGTDLFGEDRMLAALAAQHGRDADGIAAGLVDEVRRYSQDASDDQAILVVRVPER